MLSNITHLYVNEFVTFHMKPVYGPRIGSGNGRKMTHKYISDKTGNSRPYNTASHLVRLAKMRKEPKNSIKHLPKLFTNVDTNTMCNSNCTKNPSILMNLIPYIS